MEAAVAKGQKRSGREPKKPKKQKSEKLKTGVGAALSQAPGTKSNAPSKKV